MPPRLQATRARRLSRWLCACGIALLCLGCSDPVGVGVGSASDGSASDGSASDGGGSDGACRGTDTAPFADGRPSCSGGPATDAAMSGPDTAEDEVSGGDAGQSASDGGARQEDAGLLVTCDGAANGGQCDDHRPCTHAGTCVDGVCEPGEEDPKTLCPGGACHTRICAPDGSCDLAQIPAAKKVPCDDDNHCTVNDTCGFGTCVGSVVSVVQLATLCTDNNPCTADTCAPTGCVHTAAPAGTPCSDGDPCTTGDQCNAAGACKGKLVATSQNSCELVACDPTSGVVTTTAKADGAACDDGDTKTVNDACSKGVCVGSAP